MTAPLAVTDLTVSFGGLVHAVRGVSFALAQGRVLGVLGESGSGKSAMLQAVMGLLPSRTRIGGSIKLTGTEIVGASPRILRRVRGRGVAMIFQDPMSSFDPCYRMGDQIAEGIVEAKGCDHAAAWRRTIELLDLVQIPGAERCARAYPHELSGGMRQRCMIALALGGDPEVLLADEPTTALDVSVQMQILRLLRTIQNERRIATVFVTHDIGVLAEIADDLAVMYAGRFVEEGRLSDVLSHPKHPFTAGLLRSTLTLDHRGRRAEPIPGGPPMPDRAISGCAFAPRCALVEGRCRITAPPTVAAAPSHLVTCWRGTPIG